MSNMYLFSLRGSHAEQDTPKMDQWEAPGRRGDHRLRDGDRQARRALRHPSHGVQVNGELLPGDRPRREGQPTSQVN